MEQDKAGNVVAPSGCVAQPAVDDSPQITKASSTRGVGHQWKNGGEKPTLFGSGGHYDGATALMQTFANRQIEDSAALHGNGDDTIDSNRYQRNQSNANTEFNFSQYKTGALHAQRGKTLPGEGRFTVATTDGAVSGDMMLQIDPYSDMVDMTTQAVGAVMGNVYKEGSTNIGNSIGENPFKKRRTTNEKDKESDEKDAKYDNTPATTELENDEDGLDIDYYFDDPFAEGEKAEQAIENDFKTGLRRVNMKTSQGRQLAAVATKDDIMSAYQAANDQYAQILKDHMGKAYLQANEKTDILDKLRGNTTRYQSAQSGVADVSRERSQYYKSKKGKHGTTKLNTHLVGV